MIKQQVGLKVSTGEKYTLDWLLFSVVMRNDVFYYFLHSDCYFLAKMLLKKIYNTGPLSKIASNFNIFVSC